MPSTQTEGLRPGAGESEIELFVEKRRDELDRTMDDLRERLDVKTRSKRAFESFRRDYEKNPAVFQSTGIGIVAVGALMAAIALVKRGQNG
ncbi:MAG: DUF3618 domain-containing protein [Actinomycetota bacterium]|nr:DUF3618 domain-containing protein [Actinomycetota bacterium]